MRMQPKPVWFGGILTSTSGSCEIWQFLRYGSMFFVILYAYWIEVFSTRNEVSNPDSGTIIAGISLGSRKYLSILVYNLRQECWQPFVVPGWWLEWGLETTYWLKKTIQHDIFTETISNLLPLPKLRGPKFRLVTFPCLGLCTISVVLLQVKLLALVFVAVSLVCTKMFQRNSANWH